MMNLKKALLAVFAGGLMFVLGAQTAANKKPKSLIHVVTLYWADGVTDAQKQQVFAGVEKMAQQIPGLTRVWLRSVKVQGQIGAGDARKPVQNAFVMEFESEAALKVYADHPAHKAWEEIYVPLRGASASFDITN